DLAVVSTGQKFENINKSSKVKKLEKRLKRLQRKLSKKYELNKIQIEGGEFRYRKTNNIKKLEFLVLKTHRRLKNIRHDYIHQITTFLVKTKPEYVVMEDLNTKGILQNRRLAKAVQEQMFREFIRQMEYKCQWNSIRFILADRFYPSSKTCSRCGSIKEQLSLSERKYKCNQCGFEIDRDLNASINLKNYGKSIA
ncbi:MAG: transposase, partial [Tepidanaerobacteraceae bacterium]